jgi:hypothetical protein
MNIEEIIDLWSRDSKINQTDIAGEASRTASLHSQYYNVLIRERLLLRRLEFDLRKLRLAKYEFFTQGHDETTRDKGWKLPPKGVVLKSECQSYIEADDDVIGLGLKISVQSEKVDFLESILKVIMNRNYALKTILDYMKFSNGVF